MSSVAAIYRRELAGLFLAPLAWILLCVTLFLNGWVFWGFLRATGGDVNWTLRIALGDGTYWMLMAFLPPLITMRMISEEARTGTLEFVLTAPVRDAAVVLGKALAAITFMVLMWSSAGVYALVMLGLGGAPDWGQVLCGLGGSALVSALLCALGLVTSAMTATPLLAAFLGFLLNVVLLFVVPQLAFFVRGWQAVELEAVLHKLDLVSRYSSSFQKGIFDSADATFFLAWTALALFVCVRLVEARRWR
jgi:ABC-2 type transport system permease protein